MKTSLAAFAVLLLASASTAAMAQTMGGAGSTTGTMGTTAARGSSGATTDSAISTRRGPAQREMELVQTSLLNQFGQLGFAELRSLRKQGTDYVAEVTTVTGEPATVVIDARTREVRSDMAAAGHTTGSAGTTGTSGAMGSTIGAGTSTGLGTQPGMGATPGTAPQPRAMNRGSTGTGTYESGSPMTGPGVGSGTSGMGPGMSGGPTPLTGQGQSVMGDRTGSGTTSPIR